MKKYTSTHDYVGITHYLAICRDCGFTYEDHTDRERGVREIRRHVEETGHTVNVEKGVAVVYRPDTSG